MAAPTKMSEADRARAERLAARAARLTDRIEGLLDRSGEVADERAAVWAEANDLGYSYEMLAERAGLHPSQIHKAVKRHREKLDDAA